MVAMTKCSRLVVGSIVLLIHALATYPVLSFASPAPGFHLVSDINPRPQEYDNVHKRQVEPDGLADCPGFPGDPDTYGLGIRIGFYLQTITANIACAHIRNQNEVSGVRVVNNCFQGAIFVGLLFLTITKGSTLFAVEVYIILQFFMFGVGSFDPYTVPKSNSQSLAIQVILHMAFLGYTIWFLNSGMEGMMPPATSGAAHCSVDAFFLGKVNIFGWYRIFLRVISVYFCFATVVQVVKLSMTWRGKSEPDGKSCIGKLTAFITKLQPSTSKLQSSISKLPSISKLQSRIFELNLTTFIMNLPGHILDGTLKLAPSNKGLPDWVGRQIDSITKLPPYIFELTARCANGSREHNYKELEGKSPESERLWAVEKMKFMWELAGTIVVILFIIGVEFTIKWSKIEGVGNIRSTGQLLPIIISLAGLGRILVVWGEERNEERKRPVEEKVAETEEKVAKADMSEASNEEFRVNFAFYMPATFCTMIVCLALMAALLVAFLVVCLVVMVVGFIVYIVLLLVVVVSCVVYIVLVVAAAVVVLAVGLLQWAVLVVAALLNCIFRCLCCCCYSYR